MNGNCWGQDRAGMGASRMPSRGYTDRRRPMRDAAGGERKRRRETGVRSDAAKRRPKRRR